MSIMDKTGRLAALLPDEGDAALVLTPHNRRYLTGFPSSAGWLVVSRKGAWFFTDFRYIEAAKMRVNGAECRMITRVGRIPLGPVCRGRDPARLCGKRTDPRGIRRPQTGHTRGRLARGAELEGWMGSLRLCKTPEELARIRQAQALTEYGFEHILPFIRAGRTEREIALELEFLIRKQGAEGTAFDFIVVSGPNSSLPHGVPGERVLQDGDFVTMDFGAMVDGWRSDMTRTVAIDGCPPNSGGCMIRCWKRRPPACPFCGRDCPASRGIGPPGMSSTEPDIPAASDMGPGMVSGWISMKSPGSLLAREGQYYRRTAW